MRRLPNHSSNAAWTSAAESTEAEGANAAAVWDDRIVAVTEGAEANGANHVVAIGDRVATVIENTLL
ncbi:MAG: hypothetical protein ABI442_22485 [Gemmatimonadaceae bacterium]